MKIKVLLEYGFMAIMNLPAVGYALDPTASATLTNVNSAWGRYFYSFIVQYVDDGQLNDSSFDSHDIRITGPGGYDVLARFVGATNPNGNKATVTYSIVPPGGSWDSTDNGTYNVLMQAFEVFDTLNNPVKAGSLGSFTVAAPFVSPTPTPLPSGTPTLANVSTRLRVETGNNVLIGGFIITGTQAKKVILRALGPSLKISGGLSDPTLQLYQGSTLLEANDNWMDSPNKQAIIDSHHSSKSSSGVSYRPEFKSRRLHGDCDGCGQRNRNRSGRGL